MKFRTNHNRRRAFERSIINYFFGGGGGVGGGLHRLYARATLALGAAVFHKHTSYSVRVSASKQQTYKSRLNTVIMIIITVIRQDNIE